MVNYEKIFEPYYEGGWEAYPLETTLVTAGALNAYDAAIMHIEDHLANQNDPNDNLAETYDDTATYEAGDYRIYNGVLYKCLEDIDEAEDFDPTKWEACLVTDEMGSGGGGGTTVIANPVGEPTDDLETIQIGNTIYNIPGGGGGNANIWTGTKAEYEQQASQIPDDTVVLITDDEEHTQAFDVYSTDEQVIGTFLGETLYRKVIDCGALPNATRKNVAHGISNLGRVCKFDCTAIDANTNIGFPPPMPISLNNTISNLIVTFDATNISFNTGGNLSNYTDCKAILEYTKSV